MLTMLFAIAFFCLCIQAGVKDTMTFTIPNWMNLTFLLLFIPAAFAAQIGWGVAGSHLLAGLVALVIAYFLHGFGLFGGGDAKMIPGVILWIGPAGSISFLFGMALAGGVLGLIILLARRAVPADIAPVFAKKILTAENGIPYGVAIAAGAFVAASHSPLLSGFLRQLSGAY